MAERGKKKGVGGLVVATAVILVLTMLTVFILVKYPPPWSADKPSPQPAPEPTRGAASRELVLMTWNLRGYPEKDLASRAWFSTELAKLAPDVLCIQEIADQAKVTTFMTTESHFAKVAFLDSPDGQDNAIFGDDQVAVNPLARPTGFQHPAAAAYVTCGGFDATVITVHLSWTDKVRREQEKALLKNFVAEARKADPDVLVAGDFNTEQPDIGELASSCGLKVMVPGNVTTTGTTHAGHRYDWLLVSPDLADEEAIGAEIVTFSTADLSTAKKVSDHLPVKARFRTEEQFKDRK